MSRRDFNFSKLTLYLVGLIVSAIPQTVSADVAGYPASRYYVATDGNDSNPGTSALPFRTVQRAADLATGGQVVEVRAGSYREVVTTRFSGSSNNPIAFVAASSGGTVSLDGFTIRHNFITLDGFALDGDNAAVFGYSGVILATGAITNCTIINNLVHDWKANVYGINLLEAGGKSPERCTIKNNVLRNGHYHLISLTGKDHRIENNTFDDSNGWDVLRVFGENHVIRKNFFIHIDEVSGMGNHIDIIQGFDDIGHTSRNIYFEGNFIVDSYTQMGQINNDRFSDLVYNWTFKDNVFAQMSTSYNLNASIRGVTLQNNTFHKTGLAILGQVSENSTLTGNAFVGNGPGQAGAGWYSSPQGKVYPAQFNKWTVPITDCTSLSSNACLDKIKIGTDTNLLKPLQTAGLLGTANGNLEYPVLPAILSVPNANGLNLAAPYSNFREAIFNTLNLDYLAKQTFQAHHNFVAGSAPTFAPKTTGCTENYVPFKFCEPNGLNGGDPQFANINNPLGADGIPFTADDGLRPIPTSRLCTSGPNGGHIGAYPCTGPLERAGASGDRMPVVQITPPKPPANLRVR